VKGALDRVSAERVMRDSKSVRHRCKAFTNPYKPSIVLPSAGRSFTGEKLGVKLYNSPMPSIHGECMSDVRKDDIQMINLSLLLAFRFLTASREAGPQRFPLVRAEDEFIAVTHVWHTKNAVRTNLALPFTSRSADTRSKSESIMLCASHAHETV
jgi:hypothetical protein